MGTSSFQDNHLSQANSSQPYLPIHPHVEIFQLTVYIPTLILGLVFNGMSTWFAFCKIRPLTESVIYMASLTVLDSLMLFTLPFKIISYNKTEWALGHPFCSFLESLYFVNMYGSILISTCICVDRYVAILHPFVARTLRSPNKAAVSCTIILAGVWAGIACTYQLSKHEGSKSCFHNFSGGIWENHILLTTLEIGFFGCMFTMIFCTIQIVICLHKNQRSDDPLANKSINIITANLAVFLVCFSPYHVAFLLYHLVKSHILRDEQGIIRTFLQVSLCWANINCFLDAICYYFVFSEFLKLSSAKEDLRTDNID